MNREVFICISSSIISAVVCNFIWFKRQKRLQSENEQAALEHIFLLEQRDRARGTLAAWKIAEGSPPPWKELEEQMQ